MASTGEVNEATSESSRVTEATSESIRVHESTSELSPVNEATESESISRLNEALVASIQDEMRRVPKLLSRPSICRVPRMIRLYNEEAYTPQIVSIGPYHHGAERLQAMEEHKLRYLSHFLDREPEKSLGDYVENLRGLEQDARKCYGDTLRHENDEFLKMMLIDGCFILELFLKDRGYRPITLNEDPKSHVMTMRISLRNDLLLLENQLPFVILDSIFILFSERYPSIGSFLQLSIEFFQGYVNMGQSLPRNYVDHVKHFPDLLLHCYAPLPTETTPSSTKHFLDPLLHWCVPLSTKTMPESDEIENRELIPTATELVEAGVKFKKGKGKCFSDLKFSNGTFEIPTITVDDSFEILIRNLIAFEQCSASGVETFKRLPIICSYAVLMDSLIDTPKDVAILRSEGIIHNWLGDNEQVSQLFNNIWKGAAIAANQRHFYFYQFCKDVNTYHKTRWHQIRALMEREYFKTPLHIASSTVALIIVAGTIIQVVCAVLSTHHELRSSK